MGSFAIIAQPGGYIVDIIELTNESTLSTLEKDLAGPSNTYSLGHRWVFEVFAGTYAEAKDRSYELQGTF